jgi:predicted nucleic acid-binding Zn ribbon protein
MSFRSGSPQHIGNVLAELVARLGIGPRLLEEKAVEAWAELAGPSIIAVTDSVRVKSGRMIVKITSPTWRYELNLQREEWRDRVNEYVGEDIVREMIFR